MTAVGVRAFTFSGGEDAGTVLEGFTIVNASLLGDVGGAIYVGPESSPTIANLVIDGCTVTTGNGGAIFVDVNSAPTFTNVQISNCTVTTGNGGGVYVDVNSAPVFVDCSVVNCSAVGGSGGAAYCNTDSYTLFVDCNFTDNFASFNGGGIYYNTYSTSLAQDCLFSANSSDSSGGAAYYAAACVAEVNDCNFVGNTAAENGGGISCEFDNSIIITDSNFVDHSATFGGTLYFEPNCVATVEGCELLHGSAEEDGGAVYFTEANDISIVDCNISFNTAVRGGAFFALESPNSQIINCLIRHNEAARITIIDEVYTIDPNDPNAPPVPGGDPNDPNTTIIIPRIERSGVGAGSGIYSFVGPRLIANCDISYNTSLTSGGAVYLAGSEEEPTRLVNCLVTNNSAGRDGGGISNNWQNDLEISNCTIANNTTGDPNNLDYGGFGGGLYCSYESTTTIVNSILWGNAGFAGEQIYVGTGFEPNRGPSSVNVSYSDIMGWQVPGDPDAIDPNAVFVDAGCELGWDGATILDADPLFVGGYYLSHLSAGQPSNSPAIDSGSESAADAGCDELTTSLDGAPDAEVVDLGYHYPIARYRLTVDVGEHGTVAMAPDLDPADPNSSWYNHGTVVILTAIPDEGYRVRAWYDANDTLLSAEKTLEVRVDSNELITLEFEPVRTLVVRGSGNVIQAAINTAKNGDTIVVYAGTYDGGINLQGKAITLVSSNPDDANIVANTVIDCNGVRGFIFNSGEDANTIVDGFTVVNGGIAGEHGGGIFIDSNSSPTLINMVIRDCSVTGGDPNDPNDPNMLANGGAIYVAPNSAPVFINCTVNNCSAYIGGGAFWRCEPNSTITVEDCNFTDNTAVMGAGLYAEPNTVLTVNETLFTDNAASDYGGGMFWYGQMEISDCNFAGNTALFGGGMFCAYSPRTVINRAMVRYNRAALPIPVDPNLVFDPNDPNAVIVIIDPNFVRTIGNGGGLFSFATPLTISDSIITQNFADTSGGGMYFGGRPGDVNVFNCLVVNNTAGRDGGGVSANWYTRCTVANCTFVANAAPGLSGEEGRTGFGGGMYVSYHAAGEVKDSIFWNNFGVKGHEMAVATGFEYDPRCGTLTVSYSDVKDGYPDVWVDDGCTLNWGAGNISADPLFVAGLLDEYYLSQTAAGQPTQSPCVDAGSAFASDLGLIGYTTRVDGGPDTGIVDMGYHHLTLEPCSYCDLVYDGLINFADFAVLAERWLDEGCSDVDGWCAGADVTFDMAVNFKDVAFIADCWLVEDLSPPFPDPAEWRVEPYFASSTTVTMEAEPEIDSWGWPVEYYFECVRGACHDSGWVSSSSYTDGGLSPGVRYGYRVKARDTSPRLNETDWSPVAYAGEEDTIPPAGLAWVLKPQAVSPNTVVMVATAFDTSGVEFFFENITISGHFSGWQDEPNWIDTYLDPNTEYCYRVKARDKSIRQNETFWSDTACVRTPVPPDTTPPVPDPMMWDPNDPNLLPTEVFIGPDPTFGYAVTMTCLAAQDPSGPVQYYFECIDNSAYDSGWILTNTYTTPIVGRTGQFLRFRVRARDWYNNTTAYSVSVPAYPQGMERRPEDMP